MLIQHFSHNHNVSFLPSKSYWAQKAIYQSLYSSHIALAIMRQFHDIWNEDLIEREPMYMERKLPWVSVK